MGSYDSPLAPSWYARLTNDTDELRITDSDLDNKSWTVDNVHGGPLPSEWKKNFDHVRRPYVTNANLKPEML